ncbi:MAG: thiamine phosphate synthase [Nitrospirae bacterium]|nr:thiamine phosphate synthase [Nitrospirota bacterium]
MLDRQAAQGRPLESVLTAAAEAGVRLFQYRDKTATAAEAYRQALRLRQAAADHGAIFLVNDRCDLALAVEADGVHLGQDDLPLAVARRILGPEKIIGLSTHCEADVIGATAEGADYIGFGPLTHLPVFAIGGLTADRVQAVIQAGADGVAVISAIVGAPDVAAAARAIMARLP